MFLGHLVLELELICEVFDEVLGSIQRFLMHKLKRDFPAVRPSRTMLYEELLEVPECFLELLEIGDFICFEFCVKARIVLSQKLSAHFFSFFLVFNFQCLNFVSYRIF